jgi:hypothetical protein
VVSRVTLVFYSVIKVTIKETKCANRQCSVMCMCMLCNADRLCNHSVLTTDTPGPSEWPDILKEKHDRQMLTYTNFSRGLVYTNFI